MPAWPPLLRLLLKQPDLVVEHASAYLALASDETRVAVTGFARQCLCRLVAVACAAVATVLAGVALLLWAALPQLGPQAGWLLWVVPLLPLPLAGWAWFAGRSSPSGGVLAGLQAQVRLDREAWRSITQPTVAP